MVSWQDCCQNVRKYLHLILTESGSEAVMHPSESTRLYWTREYLKLAKVALVEAGGEYKTSMAEKKANWIDSWLIMIEDIVKNM